MIGSVLQSEIRQSKPFASKQQEAMLGLLRTADRVGRLIAERIEPAGITRQQYNVLRILRGAGEPLPTLEIAERMVEQAPGVTRLLDRMEAKGWVGRRRCEDDRRQVLCSITDSGRALLAELDSPVSALDDEALAMLSRKELVELIRLLDKVRAGNERKT